MGGSYSKDESESDEASHSTSFFSVGWLCGGGAYAASARANGPNQYGVSFGGSPSESDAVEPQPVRRPPAECSNAVDEAARVRASADLFVLEFKRTMKHKGFTATKYARNGKASKRVYHLDAAESRMFWRSHKSSAKVVGGDKFDDVALDDISEVSRGAGGRRGLPERSTATVHCSHRTLVIGFDTEGRCEMFADGMALLVAEIRPGAYTAKSTLNDDDDVTTREILS